MLMRTDPFRELDRLSQQVLGNAAGTWSRPTAMAMDAWRAGDTFVVAFDLPGVDPQAIELDVERNVLTVKAERRPVERASTSRCRWPSGRWGVLAGSCSSARPSTPTASDASYDAGVLTLRIPIAEKAKPRKISISAS
jgi:HSP20 family protein